MTSATVNTTSVNMREAPAADDGGGGRADPGPLRSTSSPTTATATWFLVSAVVEGATRIGWIRAEFLSGGGQPGPQDKPAPQDKPGPVVAPGVGAKPVGDPVPFTTKPSDSGNNNGQSSTTGLKGTEQKFDDGSTVIEATEMLAASRVGGFDATLTASCRRVRKGDLITVEQHNYSYEKRDLPLATLFVNSTGIPDDVPAGFQATAVRDVIASQFGKNDREDEGTGTPAMGTIQTNSEIFGASIKISKMAEFFGENWRKNERRLGTLIEIHSPKTGHRVRVPLVDVGPGEHIPAEVDLCWACDQFLGTQGQGRVTYRLLIPT